MIENLPIVEDLKEEAKTTKPERKIKKGDFLVNLYKGRPGKEGDSVPEKPVVDVIDLAKRLKEAEEKGYFVVRNTKEPKTEKTYVRQVNWYLKDAKNQGLIV